MPAASLITVGQWHLPLREASALGVRRTSGGLELLAVDDERFHVLRASLSGSLVPAQPVDVGDAFGVPTKAEGSNFEGVSADGRGRVFVLRENNSQVVALTSDLARVRRTIDLRVRGDWLGRDWAADDNARGEGLLLLRNGHLLVAKQRVPWLIEFGPVGARAEGYRTGLAVGPDDTFPLPDEERATFDVLADWQVPAGAGLGSLNDLAVDGSGRLWAVSSDSARLARLSGALDPAGASPTFDTWRLPADVVPDKPRRKAEGLVLWPGRGWLVALDLDGRGTDGQSNVFLLEGP